MSRRFIPLVLAGSLAVALASSLSPASAEWAHPLPATYEAPPAPGGSLQDLGSPMTSLTVVEGDFGLLPDGSLAAYAAPMGENAQLNIASAATRPVELGRHTMWGASGAPIVAAAPDGKVYVATYYEGHLYQWDPVTAEMTDLGRAPGGATYLYGLSVAPDGTVYGGSYPNATVWSWTAADGFTDLGVSIPDPAVQYSRVVYDPDHHALWIGTQPVAHLYRFDLTTKALTEVSLRESPRVTSVPDLDYAEGSVFVNWGGNLRVVDAATSTEVLFTDATTGTQPTNYLVSARGVSEPKQGGVYFSSNQTGGLQVVRYDLETHTVARTGHRATRGALIGYGWTVENGNDVLYAFAGNYSGGGFRFDIDANRSGSVQFPIAATPSPLQHVLPNEDGSKVFVNAFLNGNTISYDVATGTSTPVTRLGQVEDWVLSGSTLHAGTYPNGVLSSIPTTAVSTTPLTNYATLKTEHQQIRPLDAVEHDGRIWYGTEPDYGLYGGDIATVDTTTGAVQVYDEPVEDHTVSALAFVGSSTFIGSSTEGGTGTTPVEGSGLLTKWDPATGTTQAQVTPVPGADSVNALAVHNDAIYGLADGTLFEADPQTLEIRRTLDLGVAPSFAANNGELVFHPNGYLYANVGQSLVVIDPLAFEATTLIETGTRRLELSPDGSFWMLLRPDGFTSFLNLGHYVPEEGNCLAPDTSEFVTLFGSTITVRNRFLETGCTLQDLIPLAPTGNRNYAGTINPWLNRLIEAGQLSQAEKDLLWAAAKGGR